MPEERRAGDHGRGPQARQRLRATCHECRNDGCHRQGGVDGERHEPRQSEPIQSGQARLRRLVSEQPVQPVGPQPETRERQRRRNEQEQRTDARPDLHPAPLPDEPQGRQTGVGLEDGSKDQACAQPRPQGEERQSGHRHVADPQPLEKRRPEQGRHKPAALQSEQAEPQQPQAERASHPERLSQYDGQQRESAEQGQRARRIEERVVGPIDRLDDHRRLYVDRRSVPEMLPRLEVDPQIPERLPRHRHVGEDHRDDDDERQDLDGAEPRGRGSEMGYQQARHREGEGDCHEPRSPVRDAPTAVDIRRPRHNNDFGGEQRDEQPAARTPQGGADSCRDGGVAVGHRRSPGVSSTRISSPSTSSNRRGSIGSTAAFDRSAT